MIEGCHVLCFYGPESTGKTTLAVKLARRFQTEWVPEVAREIIKDNQTFTARDIEITGKAQVERILQKARLANRLLFCDSDLITTAIYSRHYLGLVPPVISELEKAVSIDLYFLFDIDVEWVDDGVRDLGQPDQREKMYGTFRQELRIRKIPYVDVKGSWEERERTVVRAIFKHFRIKP